MQQNLYAEAEILLRDVVTIWEKTLDSRHEDLALALRKLAITLSAQSDHNGALKMMRRSNALESSPSEPVWKAYLAGPRWPTCQSKGEHPTLCYTVLLPPDEYEPGEVLAGFSDRSHNEESNGRIAGRLSEHSYAMAHARIAWRAGYPRLTPPLVNETFEAAQRASATETASVLARAAARFAATDDVLIRLIRELEDLNERRLAPDPTLAQALELPSGEHRIRAQEARFWHKLDEVMERIAYINARIDQSFPNYRELVSPEPASITDVQTLLTGQEALVTYLTISPDQDLREEAGLFIWLVRPDRGEMRRVEVGEGEIAATVTALRAQLDPGQGGGRGPFDVAAAHALYRKLLPFDAASLEGIKHLYVVPHGPLESLPFSVLVASDPGQAQGDYRKVDWLVRHYAVTTLPAVSTLRALRRFAKPSRAPEPFRGVGNPVLRGYAGTERKLAADLFDARGLVDPALLRAQPALPNTALELKALAQTLGAKDKALLLGPKVTETAIKRGDLGKARIVAFATHAAIAGQLDGLAEPGLILTPPEQASEADDGYLAASEAAQLKLDADLVLLSACNTAAPDGTPGAPGLSGLAKAFIYAGARALLVSHWDVYDRAGRLLTTGMLKEERKDPALGHAEALRRSMLKLLDAGEQPYLRHPAAWAPFVIVGQGGAAAGAASR